VNQNRMDHDLPQHWKTARLVAVALLAFFGFAASLTARLATAECVFERDTVEAVRWAARAANSAAYYQRWADLEPEQAGEALRGALKANPRASAAWIELGLIAEHSRNGAEAAEDLTQAARVDRQYLPSWTLANYSFRHGDAADFWPAAARAATLAYDDLRPLLDLCDRMEPDPGIALARVGPSARLERAYLDLLIGKNRLDAAQDVARLMLARPSPENAARLTDFTERLIAAGKGTPALEIWNGLGKFAMIGPTHGVLTNGDFATSPSGAGFDWRLPAPAGLLTHWSPSALRFSFSGSEPEDCPLLEQWAPLAVRRYRLSFEYQTAGMPPATGLRWAITPLDGAGSQSPGLASALTWQERRWSFAPEHAGLVRVRFLYRREPGTTRADGRIELRRVRLEVE
jgi:tetratricopeptide (TPR) repeat protein